uniref:Centrosomal protein of 152 kDa n=1 Tax=Strigamia maritima TaxID=126957 RepID=T1JG15_STRMM
MASGYYIQNSESSLNFNEQVEPSLDDTENLPTEEEEKKQEQEIGLNLLHEFNDLIGDGAEDSNLSYSSKNDEEKYPSSRQGIWPSENLWFENMGSPCTSIDNGDQEIENLSPEQHNGYSESNDATPHLLSEQLRSTMSSDYHYAAHGSSPISNSTPCSNNSYDDQNMEISDRIPGMVLGVNGDVPAHNPEFVTGGLNPNAVPFSSYTDKVNHLSLNFPDAGRSANEWLSGEYAYERQPGKLQYPYMNEELTNELIQLRIVYDARSRELANVKDELEQEKDNNKINLENLEDQLETLKSENEELAVRLREFADFKDLVTEKEGKIAALNSRISSQDAQKLELTTQLQRAESTIESLNEHIAELERIDTISRSRTQHDLIISNMQKKHEEESQKMRENMDALCAQLQSKTEEVNILHQKLTEMSQNLVNRSDAINQLTKSLEDSQAHCQMLLKGGASVNDHDEAHGNLQKKLIASLQDEVNTLRDELEMYENANNAHDSVNDTLNLLNVKKAFSWKTPETPSNISLVNNDLVANLKNELERCLTSNRNKRSKLTKLQTDYRNNLKETDAMKSKLSSVEKQLSNQHSKIANLQAKLSNLNPMGKEQNVLNIHEMDKLRIEKEQLIEELEETKQRLNESSVNERQLDQAVRQLHQQMSQLVHDNNEDRRQALERSQQTYLQLHEESIKKIRKEMSQKHKEEMTLMEDKFKECQDEMDSVKQIYVTVCQEKTQIEKALEETKIKLDETEKKMAEMTENWNKKMKEMKLSYDLKIEEAVHQAQSKKSLQWQKNMDAVQTEKEKETINKIMDMSHRLEIEKEEALSKLEEKKNKEFLREMKKVNEKSAKDSQEAIKAVKQKMNLEKDKLIELLENGWKQNKMIEIKELEEKHQTELQQLADRLVQEKLIELKQFDEKRDKERKKLVQHIVLKKNKEKHEHVKQLEERMKKQFQEQLNLLSARYEQLERIEKEKTTEINDLKLKIRQLEIEYEEGTRKVHEKAKHDKEMLINLMEDARRKELKEIHERDKTETTNQLKVNELQEQMKLLVDEKETEKKNALMQMQTHYQAEQELISEEKRKLKDDLLSLQLELGAKNKELDDVKLKMLDQHKEIREAFKLLEQKKNKEKDDALKLTTKNSSDVHDQRLNFDCLKSLQEQNNELLKLYKNAKQDFEREKAEIQLNHNKAVTLLKEKHLHVVKALRKEQKTHQTSEPVEADAQHVIALTSQVGKLDAELKMYQAKVRELETQLTIKNGQLETLEQEQNVEMKHVEIQMHLMLQDMQTKLEEKQMEMEKVQKEHDNEMNEFQRKLIENANQDADVEKKMKEIVAQMKINEESLGEKVHELELGLEHKKTQVQLITLKANQEIEKLKNELEKANREKDVMKLSPQLGTRHVTDKSQQEKTQLKAKLRQCQKFAQNREVQHQIAIVKLQQEHTNVVKELEAKVEAMKKTSMEFSLNEVTKLHRAQVKVLKEQYSAELTAVHQQYAHELETVQGFVQHYQAMYKQLVESDPDNMIEIQDSIKQVVSALQKDLFQYLNGLNKRVAQRIHTEVMKERKMIVSRLKEQFGIKETNDLELSILHSEMEAQLHVEPSVDTWATVSHSEGFLSANAECDRIASCFELKGDTIQEDHLSKLLKQMGLHSSSNETLKGHKLEASCLRYKTPIVDRLGHEIIPLRSAFSVDHINNSNVRKDDAERKTAGFSSSDKKLYDIRSAATPATREQPIGQSASETVVFKSSKQSGKKGSPRSNRTTVGNTLDSVQTLGKKQGDDLKETSEQVPQTESEKCHNDKGIQRMLESHPGMMSALLESFQTHLQDKNYINKMCQRRTVNENQLKVGDSCASKTFVPLETESDSSVSVGGWNTGVNDTDKGQHAKGKRQWVRKNTAASVDK